METNKTILTYEGLKELQDELNERKGTVREEIAQKLKEARAQGDLSENAEYDAAKDAQRDNETRIEEIEALLKNVEVITEEDVSGDKVSIGATVKVRNTETKKEMTFKIVGTNEADSLVGKISNESPVGRAIIGAKKNQTVTVETPNGQIKYKIISIE